VAHAVCAHWGIEESLHWVLDVTFREDDPRIRRDHAPASFNPLRRYALNLIKRQPTLRGVKQKRFKAALDDNFRAQVLFGEP
jgi:predicted transposase YbfD/YdcC